MDLLSSAEGGMTFFLPRPERSAPRRRPWSAPRQNRCFPRRRCLSSTTTTTRTRTSWPWGSAVGSRRRYQVALSLHCVTWHLNRNSPHPPSETEKISAMPDSPSTPGSGSSTSSSPGRSRRRAAARWLQCLPFFSEDYVHEQLDPLMRAALSGDTEEVDALIRSGASVSKQCAKPQELTALHLAAMGGHDDVVSRLLAAGAAPCLRDGKGRLAHWWAHRNGNEELASRLHPDNWQTPRIGRGVGPWRV